MASSKNQDDSFAAPAIVFAIMPSVDPFPIPEETRELEIRSVLLLEDNPLQVIVIRTLIEDSGFIVTAVENGVDGLREVMALDFDVIICDLMMPRMPGDMFYLAVSRAKPHLCRRFVFMTGYAHEPKVADFLAKVNGTVLHKPVSGTKLMETVRAVAGQPRDT